MAPARRGGGAGGAARTAQNAAICPVASILGHQTLVLDDFPSPAVARTLSPNGRAHWREKQRAGGIVHQAVMAALAIQPIAPMTGRVVLRPTFVFPAHRRRDDDNLATGVMKVVRDSLVARGILADDSTKYVRQEPVEVVVRKGQRRLEIVIEPLTTVAVARDGEMGETDV